MPKVSVAVALALTSVLVASTGCAPSSQPRTECRGEPSILSDVDPRTGATVWRTTVGQTSEHPPTVTHRSVLVNGPCGAAVVDRVSGEVRYDAATAGDVVGVADGELFASDVGHHEISGTDLQTRTEVTSYSSNLPFRAAVVVDGSLITLDGDELSATEQSGRERWTSQIPVYRDPHLVADGHRVLVTGGDGSTFAVDVADGDLAWRTVPPEPATSYDLQVSHVPGTVLTVATTFAAARHVFVYATAATTGRLRWTRRARGVLAADRHLTVLRTANAVEAVATSDGSLRWRHPMPHIDDADHAPAAALTPDAVVVPQPGLPVLGLDRDTGRLRWCGPAVGPAVAIGRVVVAPTNQQPGVVALDGRTGVVRWSRAGRRPHQEIAVMSDHQLLVLDSDVVPHSTD